MNDVQKIRFWLNEANNFKVNKSELWGFIRMPKDSTGLPYDVYLDNSEMYRRYNHELWLYVQIGNDKIPITISDKPVVKKLIRGKAELEWIYNFIKANQALLVNLADGKVPLSSFFAVVQRNEDLRNKHRLDEMSRLIPIETNLPVDIWVDEDKLFEPHAPRIKFQADKQEKDTEQYPSMEILNPDRIHNMKKCDLSTKEIQQIKAFVKANEELLLKLSDKDISIENFKASLIQVDKKGKESQSKKKNLSPSNRLTAFLVSFSTESTTTSNLMG